VDVSLSARVRYCLGAGPLLSRVSAWLNSASDLGRPTGNLSAPRIEAGEADTLALTAEVPAQRECAFDVVWIAASLDLHSHTFDRAGGSINGGAILSVSRRTDGSPHYDRMY